MKTITYDSPEGRQMDLLRVIRRTFHRVMPIDYTESDVPDVKQDVRYTRKQLIYDDGHKEFTEWSTDDPYWHEYKPENIDDYSPSQELIEAKEISPDDGSEEITITYSRSKDEYRNSESHKDSIDGSDENEMNTEVGASNENIESTTLDNNSESSKDEYLPSKEASAVTSTSQLSLANAQDDTVTITKEEYKKLKQYSETNDEAKSEIQQSKSISYLSSMASPIASETTLSSLVTGYASTEKGSVAKESVELIVKPFRVPRKIELIPLSDGLAHLREDSSTAKVLRNLKVIGYYYFDKGEWHEKRFFSEEVIDD